MLSFYSTMAKYASYLVCKDHLSEVHAFLRQFFSEQNGRYNHPGWVTFVVPETNFAVNLMKGNDQPLTQNLTFEIDAGSLEALQQAATRFCCQISSFVATETGQPYRYHYIEIDGPANVCKVEIHYIEEIG